MKKAILIFLAGLTAFFASEAIVGKILGYPPYGVLYKVKYRMGGETWTNIRKPHAEVYNVENNTLTNFNNHGLPGNDIINFDNPIVLLGSSLVEALQHEPGDIASSVFENKLRSFDPTYDVINLGCSGHDPYDSYFRLKYFERKLGFSTERVLLLISGDAVNWFKRHPKPFRFEIQPGFGRINEDRVVKAQIFLRNASSLVELYVKGIIKDKGAEALEEEDLQGLLPEAKDKEVFQEDGLSEEMQACLRAFDADYEDFIVVSITGDAEFNAILEEFCRDNDIEDMYVPIKKPEYLIGGAGHINEKGNQVLGSVMAGEFIKTQID